MTPEQLNAFIIEATMVKYQFPSGRGGCKVMFDQSNYFSTNPDGHWDWFTSEEDFPYSSDHEQNYTIATITYFDNDGNSIPVDITVPDSLYEDMSALGKKHRLGDYKIWNTNINSNEQDLSSSIIQNCIHTLATEGCNDYLTKVTPDNIEQVNQLTN